MKPIVITYNWQEFGSENPTAGIALMLIYALFISVAILTYIMFSETE